VRQRTSSIPDRPAEFASDAAPRPPLGSQAVATILASIGEAAYQWDLESDALSWADNAGAVLTIGDIARIATGRSYARYLDPANLLTRFDAVTRSGDRDRGTGVPYQVQYCFCPRSGDGCKLWVEDTGRWFAGPDGRPLRASGVVRVINERHAREEHLAYLSRFDGLTGEMNRLQLIEVLRAAVEEASRQPSCGFLLVSVDNLGRLNEAYGFAVADEVISSIAKRIRARMRGGDALGRFSGNKLGVVLENCTADEIAAAAHRLLAAVREEVVATSAGAIAATITIGGIAAPRHARSAEEALARAQEALETAKMKRHGSFELYQPSAERELLRRENIRAGDEIVAALNERRILLAFEPIVEIASRKPRFYECLMRIRRPDGTLAASAAIIAIAERLGLVRLIDHRMLELVMDELAATPELHASLNLSSGSTTDPDWWSGLEAQLRAHPGIAGRLILEITETAAIHNLDETRDFVARAKDFGCRIAIDDFGAGFTSFRSLRKLGVDMIKIDGAFVQNLARSEDDRVFVRTLIELGRGLGVQTVAEWVRDEETAALLKVWGCDFVQGELTGSAEVGPPWVARTRRPGQARAASASRDR
jgi:diguanylate cyclase (GGDEF)-like protein